MRIIVSTVLFLALIACGERTPQQIVQGEEEQELIDLVENAHEKEVFLKNAVVQFKLNLRFGGKERFVGTVSMTTDGSKVKMEQEGKIALWDGEKAMVFPKGEADAKTRFDLLTWSYFFLAPYKLNDPGVQHKFLGDRLLNGQNMSASKMTFQERVGDTPDDWYIVYKDYSSDFLVAMAYIVTGGGKSKEEAEQDPHAIVYENFISVGGVPFATNWTFWTWNAEGEMDKQLGIGELSEIELIEETEELFNPSALQ